MTALSVVRGDITTLAVDAIVNAANNPLVGGAGVDGAIHRVGGPSILAECQAWVADHGPLPTGEAMVTTGGDLPARFVIHTVGPIYGARNPEEAEALLARCYTSSLDIADRLGCATVAFPNISTGVYGYPKVQAAQVAVDTVTRMRDSLTAVSSVIFVCFNEDNAAIYSGLLAS